MEQEFVDAAIDWNGKRSCFLLSFDCDFPEDAMALPAIAEDLKSHGIHASFACVGRWVEEFPDAHIAVLECGHELFNHSYSHPNLVNSANHFVSSRSDFNHRTWSELTPLQRRDEIRRCQDTVGETLSYEMRGFRIPHFGNAVSEGLHADLEEIGMSYSSSCLAPQCPRLGLPYYVSGVLEIPVTSCPKHPYASFDSWHALYAHNGWHRDDFIEVFEERVYTGIDHKLLTNIYLDPKDRKTLGFGQLFETIAALKRDCWYPTYSEFSDWFESQARKGACSYQ